MKRNELKQLIREEIKKTGIFQIKGTVLERIKRIMRMFEEKGWDEEVINHHLEPILNGEGFWNKISTSTPEEQKDILNLLIDLYIEKT